MGAVSHDPPAKKMGLVLQALRSALAVPSRSAGGAQGSPVQAELQVKGSPVFHFSKHKTGRSSSLDRSSHADRFLRGPGMSVWAAPR